MLSNIARIAVAGAAFVIAVSSFSPDQQVPEPTPLPLATNPSVPSEPSSLPITGPLAPPLP